MLSQTSAFLQHRPRGEKAVARAAHKSGPTVRKIAPLPRPGAAARRKQALATSALKRGATAGFRRRVAGSTGVFLPVWSPVLILRGGAPGQTPAGSSPLL